MTWLTVQPSSCPWATSLSNASSSSHLPGIFRFLGGISNALGRLLSIFDPDFDFSVIVVALRVTDGFSPTMITRDDATTRDPVSFGSSLVISGRDYYLTHRQVSQPGESIAPFHRTVTVSPGASMRSCPIVWCGGSLVSFFANHNTGFPIGSVRYQ